MKKTRMDYVPPRMEVYRAESPLILAGPTEDGEASGSAGSGTGDGATITGAKTVILGREFDFSDVWDD